MQSHGDLFPHCDSGRLAQDVSRRIVNNSVPALEHAQRAALFKLHPQPLDLLAPRGQHALDARAELTGPLVEPGGERGDARPKIKRSNPRVSPCRIRRMLVRAS